MTYEWFRNRCFELQKQYPQFSEDIEGILTTCETEIEAGESQFNEVCLGIEDIQQLIEGLDNELKPKQ